MWTRPQETERQQKRLNVFTLSISSPVDAQNINARSSAPWVKQRESSAAFCHVELICVTRETLQAQRISNYDKLSENVFLLDNGGAMFQGLLAKRYATFKCTSAMTTLQTWAGFFQEKQSEILGGPAERGPAQRPQKIPKGSNQFF